MRIRPLPILLLACVTAWSTGCVKVLSEPVLEDTVASLMSTAGNETVTVDCPAARAIAADDMFFCSTRAQGRRGTVLVRQLDDWGRVELVRENPLPPGEIEPLVERWLRSSHDIAGAVTCPSGQIQEPSIEFTCTTRSGARVAVYQVDGVREYSFSLERAG